MRKARDPQFTEAAEGLRNAVKARTGRKPSLVGAMMQAAKMIREPSSDVRRIEVTEEEKAALVAKYGLANIR